MVPGVLATLVWDTLVQRIGAIRASSFHVLNRFFGETISLQNIAGVVVSSLGIIAVQISKR